MTHKLKSDENAVLTDILRLALVRLLMMPDVPLAVILLQLMIALI